MSCCGNIADLGCVSICGTVMLPFFAEETGTHIFEISFLNIGYSIAIEAEEGQPFELPLTDINESACISFRIKKPDCGYYVATIDGADYDCFTIKTKTQIFLNNTSAGDFSCPDFNNDFL